MDFTFSEDQNAIASLARQIFSDRASDEFLLEFSRSGATYDDQLWQTLAEQGLLGISIAEQFGGTGLGLTELCLLLEEQSRHVAPTPLYSSLVLGALPIAEFGSDQQCEKYLKPLASGDTKLTAAIAELGIASACAGRVQATLAGDEWQLRGELSCVPDSPVAHAILIPAHTDTGITVFIVDTDSQGLSVEAQQSSLGDNEGNITLNDVRVSAEAVLGKVDRGHEVIDWLELRAETALCALTLGVTEEALKRTAEFTCERKQFGVAIGSFQAVAMQAADAFIDVEAIRSSYWLALYKLEQGLPAEAEVRCAKWFTCDAGHRVVYRTQHLHGGMGSDVEYPIHRFFLWAKHLGMMLGGRSVQLSKLGALLAADDSVGTSALQV